MNTRLVSLLFIFILVAVLGVLQQVAFEYYLYWRFSWYDILMHFLGGAIVGSLFLWFMRFVLPAGFGGKYSTFFWFLLFVLAIGGLWEVYEYTVGIDNEFNFAVRQIDTFEDLVMDVLGATLSFAAFARFKQ